MKMGQLYASREILANCKIFSLQRLYGHLCGKGRGNIEGLEVRRVIRWNVKITRWNWSGTTTGTSSFLLVKPPQ